MTDADGIHWDERLAEAREALKARDGAQWKLGDLANEVRAEYGEKRLQEFARELGVDYNAILGWRTVASAFESSTRVEDLSWTHHREVASRADRLEWLDRARTERWSTRRMVEAIAEADRPAAPPETPRSAAYEAALAAQGTATPAKRRQRMKAIPTVDTKLEKLLRELADIADRFEDTEMEYLPYDLLETRGAQTVSIGEQMLSIAKRARRSA